MKITKSKLRKLIREALTDLELSAAADTQKELELRFPDLDFSNTLNVADKFGSHSDEWTQKSNLALDEFEKWSNKFQPNLKGVFAYAAGAPSMFAKPPANLINLIKSAAESAPNWAKSTKKYRQIESIWRQITNTSLLEPTKEIDGFDHESWLDSKREKEKIDQPIDTKNIEKEIEDKNQLELEQGLSMVDDELSALKLKRRKKRQMMSRKI
jgi:hypothetical protein|tara:strand:- start:1688 stop:2323 length:636 start_codon:yes stop_codon:yes gene_type:complete